ncbi:MAG: oligosaccharide flippase family protein [Myxococcales bacterium]|nr:oligosaccharide flippase family protein [Myxococcales bacterium]
MSSGSDRVPGSSPANSPADGAAEEIARSARRGVLYISLAKVWFLLAGLFLPLVLPRVFATATFGMWTLVSGWFSPLNNVIVTATIQAVSKFAASGSIEAAKTAALRMNVLVAGGVAGCFFLVAPAIAHFEHDPELIPLLRVSSLIVLLYGFYAVFVGAANGAREFHKQSGLDILFATLRVGFVLFAAITWHATMPALVGWVLAAALILIVSVLWVGLPRRAERTSSTVSVGQMLGFVRWLFVYHAALNALMFLDGWWLKRLCTEAMAVTAQAFGSSAAVKQAVDALVGVYGSAQTVARLPYQLMLVGTFVAFPLLSLPAVQNDPSRARAYVISTLRFSLMASLGMVVALGARPEATMSLLYKAEYVTGSPALAILLCAYACFALSTIIGTITNALGHTRDTALLGIATVVGSSLAVYASIQGALVAGVQPLRGAAMGLLFGMGGGLLLNLIYLWIKLRVTLPLLSLARVAVALGAGLAVGRCWPAVGHGGLLGSKFGTLLASGTCLLVYLAVLIATRELSPREILSQRRARPQSMDSGDGAAAAT